MSASLVLNGIIEYSSLGGKGLSMVMMVILLFVNVVKMVHTCLENSETSAVNRRTKHINWTWAFPPFFHVY